MDTPNGVTKLNRESSDHKHSKEDTLLQKQPECKDHNHTTLKEKIRHFIGIHSEAPVYMRGNAHIKTGYRVNFNSLDRVLQSLFIKHNESYNIWSHLIGFIFVILSMLFIYYGIDPGLQTINISEKANCTDAIKLKNISTLLNELLDLHQPESALKTKSHESAASLNDSYGQELQERLNSAIDTVEKFISYNINYTRDLPINLTHKDVENEILNIVSIYKEWKEKTGSSIDEIVSNQQILEALTVLNQKLVEAKNFTAGTLCDKLDSESYDWLDVYKYIDSRDHKQNRHQQTVHRWPIFVFLFSAAFCLMGSSVYHLTNCMSPRVGLMLKRIDYAGISILITGSCFPPFVYGFYCQPHIARFYLTTLSVVSLIVFFVSVGGLFSYQKYHYIKGVMYGGLGLFAALPIFHLTYYDFQDVPGSDNLPFLSSVPYYVAMGASYLGGLYLYTHRIPEKFVPGKVDNCGNSHNLWHTLILIAIIFHYLGSFENYYTRMETPCRA